MKSKYALKKLKQVEVVPDSKKLLETNAKISVYTKWLQDITFELRKLQKQKLSIENQ